MIHWQILGISVTSGKQKEALYGIFFTGKAHLKFLSHLFHSFQENRTDKIVNSEELTEMQLLFWNDISAFIYTFVVSRAFMASAASQAGDTDSSVAPGLTSGLQESVNVHRGVLFFGATVTVHQVFCILHSGHTLIILCPSQCQLSCFVSLMLYAIVYDI